ncbi:conserved hypothetical protein [Ricinus communis]|uniref:Uncharacterized protein n=1 Tax=Ricinus communis TaxID=3988 RepID=B9T221_RICCO|nr:conserved hypothetical protein [Ricinus communis]
MKKWIRVAGEDVIVDSDYDIIDGDEDLQAVFRETGQLNDGGGIIEGSSYYKHDSDKDVSASEAEDEEEGSKKKKLKFSKFNTEKNMEYTKFEVRMLFKDKEELKRPASSGVSSIDINCIFKK